MKIIWKTIILVILTSFLFYLWSSNFTPKQQVQAEGETSGSTIGGQGIDSLKKEEIISLLNNRVLEWKQHPIMLTGNDMEIEIEPEWITFDVEASVNEYLKQVETPWFAFWESAPIIHIPLQFTMSSELTAIIEGNAGLNKAETIENIKSQVSILSTQPIEAVVQNVSSLASERIAFSLKEITVNTVGLSEVIAALNEQVISTGQAFSFLDKTSEISSSYSDETADFIASVLYSVILQTDYEIVERHSQGVIPSYSEPGIEADIDLQSKKDLKFASIDKAAVLKVSIQDSNLLIELNSLPNETVGKHEIRDREVVTPRTIYRYSPDLKLGEENLIQEGAPGLRVSVYRIVSDKKGTFEKEELISQDYYSPTHRIVLKSSLPSETNLTKDPDLDIDLNGDGLSDMNENESTKNTAGEKKSENSSLEDDLDSLPEGSYYDKAGNIITPE